MNLFKKAKKLGYYHYTSNTIKELDSMSLYSDEYYIEMCMLQRWLIEEKGIDVIVDREFDGTKRYTYVIWEYAIDDLATVNFLTYQEALHEGLYQAVSILIK